MKKVKFIEKDNNWTDGTTTYWFAVDGETFGVVEGGESWNSKVVDCDGMPSDAYTLDDLVVTDEMRAI